MTMKHSNKQEQRGLKKKPNERERQRVNRCVERSKNKTRKRREERKRNEEIEEEEEKAKTYLSNKIDQVVA